ncbi:phage DNA packaging protein J [Streptomyces xanthophaeus]|nr:phage DNA packaging protein J [Streptomyces xanthophaeus]
MQVPARPDHPADRLLVRGSSLRLLRLPPLRPGRPEPVAGEDGRVQAARLWQRQGPVATLRA